MTLTERMARFAAETPTGDIPANVLVAARDAVMDTIGVALPGSREDAGGIALAWVEEQGARPRATVWGRSIATSPAEAAFANGIAAHALDFDDSLPTLRGHPSGPMVSAALAVGEAVSASGAELLAAYAVGLEIAGKLGRALGDGHYLRGWHTTATAGVLSCATAAGRLYGLDAAGMRTAWGLAASQMTGLVRNFGTMTKPFHVGQAARAGVLSAWLARRGFTADVSIFDGRNSVLHTYAGDDAADLGGLLERLGAPWEILEPGISVKRWPCCYCNHRPIAGLLAMRAEHGLRADEVERIDVGFIEGTDAALISSNPATGLEGKFSIEYVAAATLLDGKVGLETFGDEMVQRPQARALMAKVRRHRIPASAVAPGAPVFADVAVSTARGRFETRIDRAPGSRDAPMTPADRADKFMDCALRVLAPGRAEQLRSLLARCEQLQDVGELARATAA
ncbi:MmgE/PrpD family protein [Pigmentiphaga soli]|uniref:MmgE/PrpD family protein n=1 Tax=Pigmentiphaga soli TaxID=1007095 RepID=A0ABP8GNG1_9BURK